MSDKKSPSASQKDRRNARLGQALRENLKRRKAQARGRSQDIENTNENSADPDGQNPPDSAPKPSPSQRWFTFLRIGSRIAAVTARRYAKMNYMSAQAL